MPRPGSDVERAGSTQHRQRWEVGVAIALLLTLLAIARGLAGIIRQQRERERLGRELSAAVIHRYLAGGRRAIANGADVNSGWAGDTGDSSYLPLADAAYYGYKDIVVLLLRAGADPNGRYPEPRPDGTFVTVLQAAQAGATRRDTPAQRANCAGIVRLLRQHGARR
jgi:hypothetical protein